MRDLRRAIVLAAAAMVSTAGCGQGAPAGAAAPAGRAAPAPTAVVDAAAIDTYLATCSDADLMSLVESTREQLTARLLTPDPKLAAKHRAVTEPDGAGINRILERGRFEGLVAGRGGGAYFSFTTEKNDYGAGPDIELQRGDLSSGFAGRDAGVVHPIGSKSIEDVTLADVPGFMLEPDAERFCEESRRAFRPPPAAVGTTYLVRSVRWDEADIVAAFEVVDKDDHGITFVWRVLQTNAMPVSARPSRH